MEEKQELPFVGAFDIDFEPLSAIALAVYDAGGSDDDLQAVAKDPERLKVIASIIVGRAGEDEAPRVVGSGKSLFVQYFQPEYDALQRLFQEVDKALEHEQLQPIPSCEHVPVVSRNLTFEVVYIDCEEIGTKAAIAEIQARGFRPALYEELLVFLENYPLEEQKAPIAALGSTCLRRGVLCSPYVSRSEDKRFLHLAWIESGWDGCCGFLAVRE